MFSVRYKLNFQISFTLILIFRCDKDTVYNCEENTVSHSSRLKLIEFLLLHVSASLQKSDDHDVRYIVSQPKHVA